MKLNEKIFQHRRQLGLSQEELAERLGVSRQAVSKWELGVSLPELDTVVALAKTFGVTTDYLLRDEYPAKEEEPAQNTYTATTQPTASYPDWLDRLPGFLGKMLRRFGWLAGVYMAVIGGLFTLLGALARFIAQSMFNSFESISSGMFDGFDSVTSGFGGMGSPFDSYTDSMFDTFNQQVSNMAANNPVTIMANFLMILGIVMLIGGIILAIFLKKKFSTQA